MFFINKIGSASPNGYASEKGSNITSDINGENTLKISECSGENQVK